MDAETKGRLLGRYLAGTLPATETEELMRLAFEDQEVFSELLTLEPLRDAIEDPAFRREVRTDLRSQVAAKPLWREHLSRLFWPVIVPVMALAGLSFFFALRPTSNESLDFQMAMEKAASEKLPLDQFTEKLPGEPDQLLQAAKSASRLDSSEGILAFDRAGQEPEYRLGYPIRIGFRIARNSNVVVVEEREDGRTFRLFPNRFQQSPTVRPGAIIWMPPEGQGPLNVEGPPGVRKVHLLVFPLDIDPLSFAIPWGQTQKQASVLTRSYRILP